MAAKISVVTPTLYRPREIRELLNNLSNQTILPFEVIIIDGAPPAVKDTENLLSGKTSDYPFDINYIRQEGGTAVQRSAGIDAAKGDFLAFIDDDIRLEHDFFETILEVFNSDRNKNVGGVAGYISNQFLDSKKSKRWRIYRKLRLFTTYEPGRYDYETGYPINRYLQAPHRGIREIDFMGSNCGVWRKEVCENGLRFDEFFIGFGILEDAHFALRAKLNWNLLECGRARCVHLHSSLGREKPRLIAKKTALNYRYVFIDIVPNRTFINEFRFWRVQLVDLIIFIAYAIRTMEKKAWQTVLGKAEGILEAIFLRQSQREIELVNGKKSRVN